MGRPLLTSFCDTLRDDCRDVWQALHDHPFIRELAAGTLAPDRFRFYVEQDLFFLSDLTRALALGMATATDDEQMRSLAEEAGIVAGRERENQAELLARVVALGAADRGGAVEPAPATVAYGGYLVAAAARGGALELTAALLPCTWSYADIAVSLADEIADHPVYGAWVGFFADPAYVELIAARRAAFDERVAAEPEPVRRRLSEAFTTSTRLERAFWDMAYACERWPDRNEEA